MTIDEIYNSKKAVLKTNQREAVAIGVAEFKAAVAVGVAVSGVAVAAGIAGSGVIVDVGVTGAGDAAAVGSAVCGTLEGSGLAVDVDTALCMAGVFVGILVPVGRASISMLCGSVDASSVGGVISRSGVCLSDVQVHPTAATISTAQHSAHSAKRTSSGVAFPGDPCYTGREQSRKRRPILWSIPISREPAD